MNARRLAESRQGDQITFIEGDFYHLNPDKPFDIVCYFAGFGIGTDEDQQRLLHRMATWLRAAGRAYVEVYTPWYWKHVAGTLVEWPDVSREYDFDNLKLRLLDTWWPTGHPDEAVTQSLRCYSVGDLETLLEGTPLKLAGVLPRGCYNHKTKVFHPTAPLEEAMQFMAVLVR
jgi:hypothetical protein